MRGPLTLQERLEAARAELWLCRLACDLTLARWAAAIPEPPADPAPAAVPGPAEQATSWPVWQPIWLHDRCRPISGRVVVAS